MSARNCITAPQIRYRLCSRGFDGTKSQIVGDLVIGHASPHLPRLSCLRRMWLPHSYAALLMTTYLDIALIAMKRFTESDAPSVIAVKEWFITAV